MPTGTKAASRCRRPRSRCLFPVFSCPQAIWIWWDVKPACTGDKEFRHREFGKSYDPEAGGGELTGGVVDAGEADGFSAATDGGEVVRALVVEQGVVVEENFIECR